jgi:hypothetical protein
MDASQQRSFIRFLAKELKTYNREVMVYQLFAHMLKQAGVVGVDEVLEEARYSPELQARFDKHFEGFDELLPPPDPGYEDLAKEILLKWKPKDGLPN